jgi:hypothetical protein
MAVTFNPFTGNLDFVNPAPALGDLTDVDLQSVAPEDGEALIYDDATSTWIAGTAAAGAAGNDTEIQYNDNGTLAGDADLTWDTSGATSVLGVGGDINLDDGGTYTTTLQVVTPTGSNKTISFPDATGTVGLVAGSTGQVTYNDAGAYAGLATVTTDGTNVTLTGRFISSLNGALSATGIAGVPIAATGTWITGGTATTCKPQFLLEPTGSTSNAWSTSGTALGVNASSVTFAGLLADMQANGSSRFSVSGLGRVTFGTTATTGAALTTELPARLFSGTGTYTDNSSAGTTAHGAIVAFDNPAIAGSNARTYTNATTVYIDGAPTASTNITITNAYSFFVNAGVSYFGGNLQLAGGSNVVLSATTGTQIGTADTQLLGFYGKTAIARPASADQAALGAVTTVGTNTGTPGAGLSLIGDTSTTDQSGALMDDLAALREDLAAAFTLINQLRTDLVNIGLIKGAA